MGPIPRIPRSQAATTRSRIASIISSNPFVLV